MRRVLASLLLIGFMAPGTASASLFLGSWGVSYGNWNPVGFGGDVCYWVEDWRPGIDNAAGWLGPGDGGDAYDVEAGYFGSDASYYYLAVVTGFDPAGRDGFEAGDLFLDIANDGSWDYAFDASAGGQLLQGITSVENSYAGNFIYYTEADPFRVLTSGGPAAIPYDYSYAAFDGRYAIEARINRAALGEFGSARMHWTMGCGNDLVDLVCNPVPEPATLLLLGVGLAGPAAGVLRRRRRNA